MASLAQLEANRLNATKSTGPRTAEGKESSRRNALKHGLAAESLALILPAEESEAAAARVAAWAGCLGARDVSEEWLVGQVAAATLQVERCQRAETALRVRSSGRAAQSWDEDRAAEAEDLGKRLAKSPSVVAAKLRRTKHGCAWLIARWEGLRRALGAQGGWAERHKRLALDLLGTPSEFRDDFSPLDGDRDALVSSQLGRLEALRTGALGELDDLERAAAEVGLGDDIDRAIRLTRRYESAAFRRVQWALNRVGKGRPPAAAPRPAPIPVPTPVFAPTLAPIIVNVPAPAPAARVEVVAVAATSPPAPTASTTEAAPAPPPAPATERFNLLKPLPPQSRPPVGNRKQRRAWKARNRRL